MIKSMTGYGRGEAAGADGRRFTVEIRSVNHRYCDLTVKLPRRYAPLEGELKKAVAEKVSRGKIDVIVIAEGGAEPSYGVEVNYALAAAYHSVLHGIKERLGLSDEITLRDIATAPDIVRFKEELPDTDEDRPCIKEAMDKALKAHDDMKTAEGAALASEVMGRVQRIRTLVEEINGRAPEVVAHYKERLAERVGGLGYEIDQGRLAQEVAYFADRCDISEEIVRINSHMDQFGKIAVSPEPSGRRLDFLIQEMNREVNTIGSKGTDAVISQRVVDIKAELEKIREQVQNIE